MKVTLYTTPGCVACRQTAKVFEKKGIVFDTLNLEQHPELADQIRSLGYTAAPVVIADDMSWSGFRLNKIEELEKRIFREKSNA